MSIDKAQGLRTKVATIDEWLSGDVREDVIGAVEQGASSSGLRHRRHELWAQSELRRRHHQMELMEPILEAITSLPIFRSGTTSSTPSTK